ncbi:hypothetical protein KF840_09395 [bacterium]|nr:hypothetical protein [bacterium]
MEQVQQSEAEALRDKVWTFAQWGVIGLVVFLAGLFLGWQLWGQATKLQAQVEELNDKVQNVIKERDTKSSQITLIERDKKELQRQVEELKAKLAAAPAAQQP